MTKVSIIIPFYNPGDFFADCLKSAANQSLEDIEIICVDDGSTDGSFNFLLSEFSSDKRFKIISQKNMGAGAARNKAIDIATGEYILFLDSDDWIEEYACEKLYNRAKNLDVDLILFDVLWHYENRTKRIGYFSENEFNENSVTFTFNCDYIRTQMMRGILGVIWIKFYKTSLIKDNNIKFPSHVIYNDIEFHFKTIMLAETISYYPKIFYHYIYINKDSLQNSLRDTKYEIGWVNVMFGIRDFINKNNLMDGFRKEFINYFLSYSKIKLNSINREFKESFFMELKYFFESLFLTINDFDLIDFGNLVFYIHIINCDDYSTFSSIQNNFDGTII